MEQHLSLLFFMGYSEKIYEEVPQIFFYKTFQMKKNYKKTI